ncbi:MAG TPA: hypothetical protein VKA30_07560 [Actinomycetota bacterium]|nr:hypothetical protein [Actinomycetota bacterium]
MGRGLALSAALAVGVSVAGPASAGGTVFEFDSHYYVPGDHVVGSALVQISAQDEGRWYAYLVRSGKSNPRPPEQGIPLGQIDLKSIDVGHVHATISFVVPDVKPGSYLIETCNGDCSVEWFGDLVGGWFTVVATHEEIPFRALEDELTARIDTLQARVRSLRQQLAVARAGVTDAVASARRAEAKAGQSNSDFMALRAELARLREESGSSAIDLAGWFAAGVGTTLLGLMMLRRRRRRSIDTGSAEWREFTSTDLDGELVGTR